MKFPIWLRSLLLTTSFAALAWAFKDRIAISERISKIEQAVIDTHEQLNRIEGKVDVILKEKH